MKLNFDTGKKLFPGVGSAHILMIARKIHFELLTSMVESLLLLDTTFAIICYCSHRKSAQGRGIKFAD